MAKKTGWALMGKVALIELDLRKPKLSDQLNIPRNTGITNYLIGKIQADELIKSIGIENLFEIIAFFSFFSCLFLMK